MENDLTWDLIHGDRVNFKQVILKLINFTLLLKHARICTLIMQIFIFIVCSAYACVYAVAVAYFSGINLNKCSHKVANDLT